MDKLMKQDIKELIRNLVKEALEEEMDSLEKDDQSAKPTDDVEDPFASATVPMN